VARVPRLRERWRSLSRLVQGLGLKHAARHKLIQWWHKFHQPTEPFQLSTRAARFPLLCRPGTSDMEVFSQVFVGGEYACVEPRREPELIIDCGANVGYTAAYFLTRFPNAFVIAVEPDAQNAEMLERNLAPYGKHARVLRTAVWSHKTGMVPSENPFGDGREWARQVREAREGETPEILAVDIGTLIAESGHRRVGILKIDVEGAEDAIFRSDCSAWLKLVDDIAIEIHSPSAKAVFSDTVGRAGFDLSQHGDITLASAAR